MDKQSFILKELEKIPPSKKKRHKNNIVVLCPFHKDSHPSFSINVVNRKRVPLGFGRCWSCKGKGGWNTFAEKLNLKVMKVGETSDEFINKRHPEDSDVELEQLRVLTKEQIEEYFQCPISYRIEDDEQWRGFSGEFLKKFHIRKSVDMFSKDCILVPILNNGMLVGAVKAFSKKPRNKKFPSYLNYEGPWIRAKGLFPYDYIDKKIEKHELNYVIICEGMRDALTLIAAGYPALCIFGTNTWTDKKLLEIKALGVDTIVFFMDSGKSGRDATRKLLEDTKNKGIKRIAVNTSKWQKYYENKKGQKLGEEIDPNSCPIKLLKKIMKWVEEQVTT